MTDIIDQTKTFRLLEQRIAKTTSPRHLTMLNRLLQHAMGEAKPDLTRPREAYPPMIRRASI